MTLKQFFIGRVIVFAILLIIGCIIFATVSYLPQHIQQPDVPATTTPVSFTWTSEADDSLNLDGLPQTNVFLDVRYVDGAVKHQFIETTPGSCNDLGTRDADSVASSTIYQCYAAGLGYTYKVVKGESSYLIMRKEFEEGSPEYTPVEQKYQIIAEISFVGIFSATVPPVEKKPTPALGKCYVGGCSAQVCSDQEGMASTCEYRPEYACYKKSTCERQTTGKCGWTTNKELNACLASSSSAF